MSPRFRTVTSVLDWLAVVCCAQLAVKLMLLVLLVFWDRDGEGSGSGFDSVVEPPQQN